MYLFFRRLIEILVSLVSIIVLLPLLILIAILIKLTSRGPILLRQKRVGKNEKLFTILKFRTMKKELLAGTPVYIEDPKDYVTGFGRFLRKTSLDELPQLINILFGSMSVIGPRPSLPSEIELIEKRRNDNVYSVKPGITGWAQVNGRNNISIDEKVMFDSYYVKNIGFKLDIKIFFKTIGKVILSKDIK